MVVPFLAAIIITAGSGCESGNSNKCVVVVVGTQHFDEGDVTRLRAMAPSRMTRDQAARLLFDLLRTEHKLTGQVKVRSMRERLELYRDFLQKHPEPRRALHALKSVDGVVPGPCFPGGTIDR